MKRLPSKILFPGGFEVQVVLVDLPDFGEYETIDIGHGRISIDEKLTPRQRWHFLSHEMLHALVDAQHFIMKVIAP